MSTPKDILNEIKTILTDDATLAAYIQKVEIGLRENIAAQDFPIILIEPFTISDQQLMTDQVNATFRITIAAFTRAFEIDTRILGDTNYKGILDLENDIKKALGAKHPTLNSKAVDFNFLITEFEISEIGNKVPVRGVYMDIDVQYRTTFSGRA